MCEDSLVSGKLKAILRNPLAVIVSSDLRNPIASVCCLVSADAAWLIALRQVYLPRPLSTCQTAHHLDSPHCQKKRGTSFLTFS